MTYSRNDSEVRTDRMVTRCAAAGVLWIPVSDGQISWPTEPLSTHDWRVIVPASLKSVQSSIQNSVNSLFSGVDVMS